MNNNIFEAATKQKLRFVTSQGNLTTEDLWDLSLDNLDLVAKSVNKKVKETAEESFVKRSSTADRRLTLMLEIIVSIINTKLAEEAKRKNAAERKIKRDQILQLMSEKENSALKNKSLKSLEAELEKLELEEIEA